MELKASSLRIIGDSAAPGDPRTTSATVELHWVQNIVPPNAELGSEPSGLYSPLEIGTGGSERFGHRTADVFGAARDDDRLAREIE